MSTFDLRAMADDDDDSSSGIIGGNSTGRDELMTSNNKTNNATNPDLSDGDDGDGAGTTEAGATAATTTAGSKKSIDDDDGMDVGGSIDQPCYALLDGVFQDPENPNSKTRVTIPITRLPAILGRTHDTDDPHFFGLGKKKALSRKQCLIEYRVPSPSSSLSEIKDNNKKKKDSIDEDDEDGRVEWDEKEQKLIYKDSQTLKKQQKKNDDTPSGEIDIDPSELPSTGYFVIGSLGKNRIMVNQERIAQGKVAVLESGTPIRISSYMLYFLLPTDAKPDTHTLPPSDDGTTAPTTAKKKKKRKAVPDNAPSSSDKIKKPKLAGGATTGGGGGGGSYQAELDSSSIEELLERMTEAVENNEWDRKQQSVGSTIAMRAVRSAANDPGLQAIALAEEGLSRNAIMSWIEESSLYGEWVEQMLSKIEKASYQTSITKCLLKVGFTRTGNSGRYIKWKLPPNVKIVANKKKSSSPKKAIPTDKISEKTIGDENNLDGDNEGGDDINEQEEENTEIPDDDEEGEGGEEEEEEEENDEEKEEEEDEEEKENEEEEEEEEDDDDDEEQEQGDGDTGNDDSEAHDEEEDEKDQSGEGGDDENGDEDSSSS